jgi:hypothetical protein
MLPVSLEFPFLYNILIHCVSFVDERNSVYLWITRRACRYHRCNENPLKCYFYVLKNVYINAKEYRRGNKKGNSRETGNIG